MRTERLCRLRPRRSTSRWCSSRVEVEVAIQKGESYFLHGDSASDKTSNLVPSTSSHLVDGVLTPFIKLTPNVQDKFFEYDGGATAANSDIAERAVTFYMVSGAQGDTETLSSGGTPTRIGRSG